MLRRQFAIHGRILLALIVAAAHFLEGCMLPAAWQPDQQTPSARSAGAAPTSPVHAQLAMEQLAGVGEVMIVHLTIVTDIDSDGYQTEIFFQMPPGIAVVDGDIQRTTHFKANVPHTFDLHITAARPGEYALGGGAYLRDSSGGTMGGYHFFFLEVGEHATTVRETSLTPTPRSEGIVTIPGELLPTPTE